MRISSRHYQKLVAKIEGKPEERILSYLMLRSLKQARYSTENVGPLRPRRRDLHALHLAHPPLSGPDGAPPAARRPRPASRRPAKTYLKPLADECSQSERRAADAERELVEWKKVKFMTDRVGEDFDALIISTAKYGLFVELDGPVRRRPGAHRHPARRPVHLSRERPQDRRQALRAASSPSATRCG